MRILDDYDDEHAQIADRRDQKERLSDAERHAQFYVVQNEVYKLRKQHEDMAQELSELKAQLSGAKGIFYGIAGILSVAGALFADRIKELLVK